MFRHNLVVIYRNFLRYKASFFINLTGLSIGLACTLFIYLWIQSEVNVDRFHEHEGQLVQVMENVDYTDEIVTRPETPDLLAEALVDEYPEIAYGAPMTHPELFGKFTLSISKDNALKAAGSFTGKDYFKMFSFDLLHGDRNNVLNDKKAIVISESLANKLFGTTDNVVGKSIDWNLPFYESQSQVSGIFKDLPESSTESFDFMVPFDVFKDLSDALGRKLHWDNHAPYTYLMLKDGKSFDDLNGKVTNFIKARERESNVSLFLHRYADNYLHGNF
ncbi:MAG: ABC transporter permease [Bacteroidota bacterium]